MKPKELIALLQTLPVDQEVLISNEMGYPAHDYNEMRFLAGFSKEKRSITIESEIETS